MMFAKIDWRDVCERAAKTAVQAAVVTVAPLLGQVASNPSRVAIVALLGAAGGAALSAAWNVVEDTVKAAPVEPPTPLFPA